LDCGAKAEHYECLTTPNKTKSNGNVVVDEVVASDFDETNHYLYISSTHSQCTDIY